MTTSSTVSYDGSEGAEHTVEEEQSFHEEKEFPCPPHSRCIFKLIVRKLDNVDMPFTATVRRNLEVTYCLLCLKGMLHLVDPYTEVTYSYIQMYIMYIF